MELRTILVPFNFIIITNSEKTVSIYLLYTVPHILQSYCQLLLFWQPDIMKQKLSSVSLLLSHSNPQVQTTTTNTAVKTSLNMNLPITLLMSGYLAPLNLLQVNESSGGWMLEDCIHDQNRKGNSSSSRVLSSFIKRCVSRRSREVDFREMCQYVLRVMNVNCRK